MDNIISFGFMDNAIDRGTTIIDNILINHFCPGCLSGLYWQIYTDGLMRCFGNRTSHFYSAKTIAGRYGISVRALQQIYRYWEEIKAFYPEHEAADEQGYISLLRRVPRFLKESPAVVERLNGEIEALKQMKEEGSLSSDEERQLREKQVKLQTILYDYRTERDGEYKYQSSNSIEFLRDLRGLPDRVIKELIDRQKEVNEEIRQCKRSTLKETGNDEKDKLYKNDKMDDYPRTVVHPSPPNHSSPPGGEPEFALINTNNIRNTNNINNISFIESVSQSVSQSHNEESESKDGQGNDGPTDGPTENKEIEEFNRILENCHPEYFDTPEAIRGALEDMYFGRGFAERCGVPREIVRGRMRRLNHDIVGYAVSKMERAAADGADIRNSMRYLQACIYNAIAEYESDIMADEMLARLKRMKTSPAGAKDG